MAESDTSVTRGERVAPAIRPDVKAFVDYLNAADRPGLHEVDLAIARQSMNAMGPLVELPPRDLAVVRDLTCPGPAGEIPLRIYDARASRQPGPAVVFFHGGGFVIGDLDTHHSLCTEIAAELDLPVIAVDYRLAPEHPFPAAPDDCEAAARWIAGHADTIGVPVTGLVPMGDSAGGNLAIVVTQALMERPAAVPVVLQVPIYPLSDEKADHPSMLEFGQGFFLDAEVMAWFGRSYRASRGDKRAFPIHGDHANMPPTVLVTAGLDPIRDSGRIYGAELILAGSDVVFLEMKGIVHGFTQMRKAIPSAQADLHAILAAIRLLLERTK